MQCLADFILDSDLCLPTGTAPLTMRGPGGNASLTISNAPDGNSERVLSAHLTFDSESLDGIRDVAYEALAPFLNLLSYTTNRKFSVISLKRVIDWTPGVIDRHAVIYAETPEWDRAEPALDATFVTTAERLLHMQSMDKQNAALRWYRLGVEATNLEEQFSYFWFALEIMAEATKDAVKVATKCPKCQGALFCETCGNHPVHRKYAGEAIRHTIRSVHPHNASEISETLERIRHTLMHGGRISSIVDQLPCDEYEAVNKLAYVTWQAIGLLFANPDPQPGETLNFGYTDNMVRQTIVGSAVMIVRLPGDPNEPCLSSFPEVNFEVLRDPSKPQ